MAAAAALERGMSARGALALLLVALPLPSLAALQVMIVEGLGGEPQYSQQFDAQAQRIAAASRALTATAEVTVLAGPQATRAAVLAAFHSLAGRLTPSDRVIVYLIGHGTFDGMAYKFNIPGPDLSDTDIAAMLNSLPASEQLVVVTGSASGALLMPLRRPGRLVITATRSGAEKTATRFGQEFALALASPAADSNKDGQISAQEAFELAQRAVQVYFERETLLASEHAVIEGEGAQRFIVARVSGDAGAAPGYASASDALERERAALNTRIAQLQARRAQMPSAQYEQQLEPLLLQLARLQQRIDQGQPGEHAATADPGAGGGGDAPQ
jgi:hypothetical protein